MHCLTRLGDHISITHFLLISSLITNYYTFITPTGITPIYLNPYCGIGPYLYIGTYIIPGYILCRSLGNIGISNYRK
jgi:hypothetical protein